MIQKTNIIALALEHQLNLFKNGNFYHTKCPKCIQGNLQLDDIRGFYYCLRCGTGGTVDDLEQMLFETKFSHS